MVPSEVSSVAYTDAAEGMQTGATMSATRKPA